MALPALGVEEIVKFTSKQLTAYFMEYARSNEDVRVGRGYKYAVRVGSKTLWSDDTYDLRVKMVAYVKNLKRLKRYKQPPATRLAAK